jgi:thymidylate synthase (FAD)
MIYENVRATVLDHGYVKLVELWGSDERIIEAARMSTGKGFLGWGGPCPDIPHDTECRCKGTGQLVGDEKLLRYLYENAHATPFEMAGLIVEVQAPIFVFREWHRHRTQSYNEMSARYAPLPDLSYIPTVERLMLGGGHLTKQAGTVAGADALTAESASAFREFLRLHYESCETQYQHALKIGVPKELARVHLPVGRYSRMRASANLRNWLAFLTLRSDRNPGAQWEIRQYANAVASIVSQAFPRTWSLFAEA